MVGLSLDDKKKIHAYSRGMLQRLGIAAVLISDPSVILLDEPTSAMDPLGRSQLFEIIKMLRDQGKAILLSTHILSDMEKVCDRIGFLHEGKLVKTVSIHELNKQGTDEVYTIFVQRESQKLYIKLKEKSFIKRVEKISDYKLNVVLKREEKAMAQMLYAIADSGLKINGISRYQESLEHQFMEVIGS